MKAFIDKLMSSYQKNEHLKQAIEKDMGMAGKIVSEDDLQ